MNKKPIIPVRKTGKVSSHLITVDFGTVKKSSTQVTDENKNSIHLSPPVSSDVVVRFFEQNPFHYRAIMLKALCVAGIGYSIIPVDSSEEDYFNDAEFLRIKDFCDHPNEDEEVFEDILTNWHVERFSYGHGYLEIVSNSKNELAEIYNLRAYNCFPKLHYNNLYYIQKTSNKDIFFKPFKSEVKPPSNSSQKSMSEVLILKNYNLQSKYFGFPEWYPATADLVLDRSVIECRINEFANNLMIQFMIVCEGGELDSDALITIKNFLAKNYKGVENAGKVLYLNSDTPDVKIRIERLDKDVREVSYIKTREQNRDFILASQGVPSILLGAKVQGQLGGTTEIKDLFKIFNETIVKPQQKTTNAKINSLFRHRLGMTKFKFELNELTIDTLREMVEYVSKMKEAEIIDKNEARMEFGYDPVEEDVVKQIEILKNQITKLKKKLVA